MTALATNFPLPWRETPQDQLRSRFAILAAIATVLVASAIVPFINLPEEVRLVKDVLTMTHITLAPPEIKPVPPPPIPKIKEKVPPTPQTLTKARPQPHPQPRTPPAAPVRDEAAIASVTAMEDAFADMRQPATATLKSTGKLQRGAGEAATVDRAMLTANQGTRELATSGASRGEVGGVALSGRAATRVAAPASSSGRSAFANANARNKNGDDRSGQRSDEEIRRVFDANKGLLFGLYQAALVDKPELSGKLVLELVISPAGQVVSVRVVSNELDDPQLVQRVLDRVRGYRFKAEDVGTTTTKYPVHFLPT